MLRRGKITAIVLWRGSLPRSCRRTGAFRDHAAEREPSAIMPQNGSLPRSCRRTGAFRDHAAEREPSAIMPQNGSSPRSPARRSRTAGTEPGSLRKNPRRVTLQGAGPCGPGRNGAGTREATCLIMSHARVCRTPAKFRDHDRDRDRGRSPRSGRLSGDFWILGSQAPGGGGRAPLLRHGAAGAA